MNMNTILRTLRRATQDNTGTPFSYYPKNLNPSDDTKTVILFGEAGAGKTSVINFMAGREVAKASSDAAACTLEAKEHLFTLSDPNLSLRIFDTVGLGDVKPIAFLGAIKGAYELIQTLHNAGGVDLLLFCMKAGRITESVIRDYRLFSEFLCNRKVPVAIVITHLENEKETMENWWNKNNKEFRTHEIDVVAHACITTLLDSETTQNPQYARRRVQSWKALGDLFDRTLMRDPTRESPYKMDILDWFSSFLAKLRSFFTKRPSGKDDGSEDMLAQLTRGCRLTSEQAEKVLEMIRNGECGAEA